MRVWSNNVPSERAIFSAQQVGDTQGGDLLMAAALILGFGAILAAETLARHRVPGGGR